MIPRSSFVAAPLDRSPAVIVEVLTLTLVFAAAAAWPVPDLNETVYLTKALHTADPSWAAGDFFLETPTGHDLFCFLFGPLALQLGLERAAWVGRWLGWLALALGFRHAVGAVLGTARGRLLAAAGFALATRVTPMAGEWVLGGCEAKVFAWAGVFAALGELMRGRGASAWTWSGAATALHPLVGGWALLCCLAVQLAERVWPGGSAEGSALPAEQGQRGTMAAVSVTGLALGLAGLALAAVGLVPALGLTAGADPATRAAAARIYVVERLPHHLLARAFAEPLVARHVLAVLLWLILARVAPATRAHRRLVVFTTATVCLSLAGFGITLLEPLAPRFAWGLLRFYWFRMADIMVPLALAVAAARVVLDDALLARLVPGRPAVVRAAVVIALAADLVLQSAHWPLPGRTLPPRTETKLAAGWIDVCDWVREHTPETSCFLTPRDAASFTWRTGRREVVSWKNSPQSAAALVEWRRRITDCFSRTGGLGDMEKSTAALGGRRMLEVAERYGADHAIVPVELPCQVDPVGERLYANARFAVFRLKPVPLQRDAEP